MRALRTLGAVGLFVALLAWPTATAAQDGDPALPLARAPDGALPLEGTPWRLMAYHHRGRAAVPGPEVVATLRLGAGEIDAAGGCTRLRGSYRTIGSAIDFELRRLHRPACGEQTTLVQLAMESGLRRAASWQVERNGDDGAGELVLRSAGGAELLRFGLDHVAALEGATWTLASYTFDGSQRTASAEQTALLTFLPDRSAEAGRDSSGRLSGSTGCNGIVADYARTGDVLSLGQLQLTDAPCSPELAEQEAAMTSVLDATALALDLPHERLILSAADGDGRLELVAARPLEGSTWILAGPPRLTDPAARLTLRLDAGIATGEGPCGPYRADYATDGVFISFRGVEGAADRACDSARAERALLRALREAVRLERAGERLRLFDVAGSVLLRFDLPGVP